MTANNATGASHADGSGCTKMLLCIQRYEALRDRIISVILHKNMDISTIFCYRNFSEHFLLLSKIRENRHQHYSCKCDELAADQTCYALP
jgi:pantothenate kinase-related protein Tda10